MHVIAKMNFVAFHVARSWQCDPARFFFPSRVLIFAAILYKVVMYVAAFLKMHLRKLLVIKKKYGNTSCNKIKKKVLVLTAQKTEIVKRRKLTPLYISLIAELFFRYSG